MSWWYLYNESRELDAVILEINNSYWEKRNILLRVRPTSDKLAIPPEASGTAEYLDAAQLVQSLPSAPRASFYSGIWHKYIFASPFEKVDGVVSNRMMDPLQPASWKANASFSNMTTMEESGEVRMATRLTCDGPPIDPTQMNAFDVAKFVLCWTLPGMLTTPEIIFKALKIRLTGMMKMNSKPPVRSGSVGRHITKLERYPSFLLLFDDLHTHLLNFSDLESFFRAYLARCVQAYPYPVELTYLPCRSFTNETIRMRSPSYTIETSSARRLTVEPADPEFYTRIINYPDTKTALAQETQPTRHFADPTAQPLIVSDHPLLASILESASSQKMNVSSHAEARPNWKLRQIFCWSRWCSAPTFMDDFALSCSDLSSRAVYISSCLRLSGARAFGFGYQTVFGIQTLAASCLIRWLVLEGLCLSVQWGSTFPSANINHRWTALTSVGIVAYFLVMRLLATMGNWLLL